MYANAQKAAGDRAEGEEEVVGHQLSVISYQLSVVRNNARGHGTKRIE
jgi:hypothetical protein